MYLTFSLLLPCTYSQNKGCYISWVTSGTEQKGNNGSNAFMIVHQNTYRRVTFTFSEISNYWQESLLELIRQNIAGWCNKLFVFKTLWTMTSNIFAIHLNQTFLPIIWIFTEGEGDGIKPRILFKIFSAIKNSKTFRPIVENDYSLMFPLSSIFIFWRKLRI